MSNKRKNPACANPYHYDTTGMPFPDFLRSIARYPAHYVPIHTDTLLKLADEMEQLGKEAQVAHDLHDSLGVHWGDDPYVNIKGLQRDAARLAQLASELDPLDVYEKTIEIEKHWKQRAEQAEAERDRLLADNKELRDALEGVIRVADRATDEFDAARVALKKATA